MRCLKCRVLIPSTCDNFVMAIHVCNGAVISVRVWISLMNLIRFTILEPHNIWWITDGIAYKDWHDDRVWYPVGRDISNTSQEMQHFTAAGLYKIFGGNMTLYDFIIPLPLIFGALTSIAILIHGSCHRRHHRRHASIHVFCNFYSNHKQRYDRMVQIRTHRTFLRNYWNVFVFERHQIRRILAKLDWWNHDLVCSFCVGWISSIVPIGIVCISKGN